MTLREWMEILIEKQEHYAVSDDFMLEYRQKHNSKNGYISFARRVRHSTDVDALEPNQKWHFFESYILREIINGKYCCNTSAEIIYNRIKNPELLLWLAEAAGVDNNRVNKVSNDAKKIIDSNASNNVRNAAGNMIRRQLPWSEIQSSLEKEGR